MSSKKKVPKVLPQRNPIVLNPLMHKSGVHEKDDVDIARQRERRTTRQTLRENAWLDLEEEEMDWVEPR